MGALSHLSSLPSLFFYLPAADSQSERSEICRGASVVNSVCFSDVTRQPGSGSGCPIFPLFRNKKHTKQVLLLKNLQGSSVPEQGS